MSKLAIDIETIGEDFESLDERTKDSMTKWIKMEHGDATTEYENAVSQLRDGMGFSPLTGSIVAIGVLDIEKDKGVVYYQAPESGDKETEENDITYKPATEKEMLEVFWQGVLKYDQVVTFNGRSFDIPFMMLRSAINGVRPSKNLMPYRYATDTNHLDLYDQLTFYGSSRKKGTLHLFCRAFGIPSPKDQGVDGEDVTRLFNDKEYLKIAKYNVGDIRATRELYLYWEKYLKF